MPGSKVAQNAPSTMLVNTTHTTASAPMKRPPRYCHLSIGEVKKNVCARYSKSCCTARPMMAAITVVPNSPRMLTVCARLYGELTNTLPLPKEMLASLNNPPAAAIHSIANAKKTTK